MQRYINRYAITHIAKKMLQEDKPWFSEILIYEEGEQEPKYIISYDRIIGHVIFIYPPKFREKVTTIEGRLDIDNFISIVSPRDLDKIVKMVAEEEPLRYKGVRDNFSWGKYISRQYIFEIDYEASDRIDLNL